MTFIGFLRWFFGWDRDRHKHCPHPLDVDPEDEWERTKADHPVTFLEDHREPHLASDRRVDESYCAPSSVAPWPRTWPNGQTAATTATHLLPWRQGDPL